MLNTAFTAIRTLLFLTLITGVLYPLIVTGFSERLFPFQANGSLIFENERVIGSALLAQNFTKDEYFWPRPSAGNFGTIPSSASNAGPTSAALKIRIEEKKQFLLKKHPDQTIVPPDLLFASASGLDPHISPAGAYFQMQRVAIARKLDVDQTEDLKKLIEKSIEKPSFGFIGEKRINVLRLNLNLNSKFGKIGP
ncbi:potassium-transporting ATPase subunit KdpC [Leptospira sp. 201903070]|uniref:Potassium-transporting ATPase KdpC subunit n=1 Tax=Leptospira ainlahdjerensis TaxID=2810033 RepID=A0ABS2UH64_9LEPT|nr:potassium-transporting ATPase subunit KdpC [Leptospira ainlahdjerensis]MBM9578597.1 potassium-transporting ATPase subunit KdpC [Leptospira ainlahdjerensis]